MAGWMFMTPERTLSAVMRHQLNPTEGLGWPEHLAPGHTLQMSEETNAPGGDQCPTPEQEGVYRPRGCSQKSGPTSQSRLSLSKSQAWPRWRGQLREKPWRSCWSKSLGESLTRRTHLRRCKGHQYRSNLSQMLFLCDGTGHTRSPFIPRHKWGAAGLHAGERNYRRCDSQRDPGVVLPPNGEIPQEEFWQVEDHSGLHTTEPLHEEAQLFNKGPEWDSSSDPTWDGSLDHIGY